MGTSEMGGGHIILNEAVTKEKSRVIRNEKCRKDDKSYNKSDKAVEGKNNGRHHHWPIEKVEMVNLRHGLPKKEITLARNRQHE